LAGGKKLWKLLAKIFGALVFLALLALAAFSLILAKPQADQTPAASRQERLSASPALEIGSEADLVKLVSAFPAPVMSFMSGSGMTFVSATSSDTAVSGGYGRIATLYWQTADGEPVTLQSIYPADALELLERDYHFTPYTGPSLFGNASVRMENGTTLRLHTATDQGLYVVLVPRSLGDRLSTLCRSLQLFTVNPQE
jgi:hypothetical protein